MNKIKKETELDGTQTMSVKIVSQKNTRNE